MMIRGLKRDSQAEDQAAHHIAEEWQEIKTSSTLVARRSAHSAAIHNSTLYIYGGYDNNSPGILSDMLAFSLKDNEWRQVGQDGDLPGPRHSHTSVAYKDGLYLFGGMSSVMDSTNSLHRFDFNLSEWKKLAPKSSPPPMDSHRACMYGDKMIVGMGYSDGDYNPRVLELSLATLEWRCLFAPKNGRPNDCPRPRAHGSFNLLGDAIYIYGGKDFGTIFDDLWKFDLQTCKYTKIALLNPLPGRFGHSGVIYEDRLFIFGGTKGVTHERNDLILIDLAKNFTAICWADSQEERARAKEEHSPVIKKSRRDSVKKFGVEFNENSSIEAEKSYQSPGKYRNQLREANYYNDLYDNKRKQGEVKKTRRNPLLTQFQGPQQGQSLNLTSTFEILTNSIMLTMGKAASRQQRNQVNYQCYKRVPKARDNYSAELQGGKLVIFGGGMHKISFNDLILIDLAAVGRRQPPQ